MEIVKYIRELLYKHERVIIPDFGAFVTDYLPAYINKSKTYIAPPNKKVSFNASVKKDDKRLVSFIMAKEQIDEKAAYNKINDFIKKVENSLKENSKILLRGIGFLNIDNSGKIYLKQDYKSNIFYDTYGMREITLSKPEQEKVEEIIVKPKRKSFNRIYNRRATIRRVLIYTPLTAALVLIFIFFDINRNYNIYEEEDFEKYYTPPPAVHNTQKLVEEDKMVKAIDQITDKREALLYTEPSKQSYYIVAGSFKNPTNALNFKKELLQKGFSPIQVERKDDLYRIALGKFSSKTEAQQKLTTLRNTVDLSLWILTQ